MSGYNKVLLIGNLTADPELRSTTQGISVCTFKIAVNRGRNQNTGEEIVDFIRITVWRGQAETCNRYLRKGRQVFVEGHLKTNSWEAKDGTKRYSLDVVADNVRFLGTKPSGAGSESSSDIGVPGDFSPTGYESETKDFGDKYDDSDEIKEVQF